MRRYLLVDDNVALAENLAEILRDQGALCDVVHSGGEALKQSEAHRYDALLTDMRMPVMGGAELIHEIRRRDPGLPAILITAHSGDEDLKLARDEGLLALLSKPVPVQRLLELLAHARRDGFVLLVEDDAALADNLGEALQARGFTALTAGSVLETERLAKVAPCAAIVDLKVPGGPLGEAARRIQSRFPALPLFVITAHSEESPVPAAGFFRKPFDTAALLDAVEARSRT